MDNVGALLDRIAIEELCARYSSGADNGPPEAFLDV